MIITSLWRNTESWNPERQEKAGFSLNWNIDINEGKLFFWQRAVCLCLISWDSACSRHLSMEQILLLDGCWSQELKHKSHDELNQRNSAGTGHIYLLPVSLSRCLNFLAQWTKTCWKGCKKFLPLLSAEKPLTFFSLQRHKWKFRKEWVSEKAKRFIYRAVDPVLNTHLLHSTEPNNTDFSFFLF